MMITVRSFGGGREVGASCFLVRWNDINILLDAGMRQQGQYRLPELPPELRIDAILISHVHNDHIGALPIAYRLLREERRQGRIFMTHQSRTLAPIVLEDARNLCREFVPYTQQDINAVCNAINAQAYLHEFEVVPGVHAILHPAGHILGAAMIELIMHNGQKEPVRILYTGDFACHDMYTVNAATFPAGRIYNLIITESTYGQNFEEEDRQLATENIAAVINRIDQGIVLVPAFALGRAQEMLALISQLKTDRKIPIDRPVYLSSGLAEEITRVYRNENLLDGVHYEILPRIPPGEPVTPLLRRPSIIVATSGTMQETTVSFTIAQEIAKDRNSCILVVGYTPEGTPARHVLEQNELDGHALNCLVRQIRLSAHVNRAALVQALHGRTNNVLFVHGDRNAVEVLCHEWGRIPGNQAFTLNNAEDELRIGPHGCEQPRTRRFIGLLRECFEVCYGIDGKADNYRTLRDVFARRLQRVPDGGEYVRLYANYAVPEGGGSIILVIPPNASLFRKIADAVNADQTDCLVTLYQDLANLINEQANHSHDWLPVLRVLKLYSLHKLMNLEYMPGLSDVWKTLDNAERRLLCQKLMTPEGEGYLRQLVDYKELETLVYPLIADMARLAGRADFVPWDAVMNVEMLVQHPEFCKKMLGDNLVWSLLRNSPCAIQNIVELAIRVGDRYEEYGIDPANRYYGGRIQPQIDLQVFRGRLEQHIIDETVVRIAARDYDLADQLLDCAQRWVVGADVFAKVTESILQTINDMREHYTESRVTQCRQLVEFLRRSAARLGYHERAVNFLANLSSQDIEQWAVRFSVLSALHALCDTPQNAHILIDTLRNRVHRQKPLDLLHGMTMADIYVRYPQVRREIDRILNDAEQSEEFNLTFRMKLIEAQIHGPRIPEHVNLKSFLDIWGERFVFSDSFPEVQHLRTFLDHAFRDHHPQHPHALEQRSHVVHFWEDRRYTLMRKLRVLQAAAASGDPNTGANMYHACLSFLAREHGYTSLHHFTPVVFHYASCLYRNNIQQDQRRHALYNDILSNEEIPERFRNIPRIVMHHMYFPCDDRFPRDDTDYAWVLDMLHNGGNIREQIEQAPFERLRRIGIFLRACVMNRESASNLFAVLAYIHLRPENMRHELESHDYAQVYAEVCADLGRPEVLRHVDEALRAQMDEQNRRVAETLRRAMEQGAEIGVLHNGNQERTIQPIAVYYEGGTWYCRAYCKLRGAIRTFEVSNLTIA